MIEKIVEILLLALFSCKGTVDKTYTNVVPADASVVISANLNELMSNAGYIKTINLSISQ
ncbi:hypothetical protein [uncultured Bacteroides sp.]|uniref:hypothetical protein n=1 Tax=uncultured Bacteroides sp. TaxID=162156 RepID=UPI0025CD33D9|nr:hypothetical protein [uncultured Bacteroides sp.]